MPEMFTKICRTVMFALLNARKRATNGILGHSIWANDTLLLSVFGTKPFYIAFLNVNSLVTCTVSPIAIEVISS